MARPLIIGVGGSHSGAGKTTIASALLKHFTAPGRPRAISGLKRWGAVKYMKTAFYSSLIEDRAVLEREDKDTGRLFRAGAEQVLWIRGPREGLQETVSLAIERLSFLDGIVIEGNSAIEFSNPDVVIFILAGCEEMEKSSARRLIERADIIVFRRGSVPLTAYEKVYSARSVYFDLENKTTKQELLDRMDAVLEERVFDRIKQLVTQKASGGRLGCSNARLIAEELKAPCGEIRRAAVELKLKIMNCGIGCF